MTTLDELLKDRKPMEHRQAQRHDVKRLPARLIEAGQGWLAGIPGYAGDLQSLLNTWADRAQPGYGPMYPAALVARGVKAVLPEQQLPTTEYIGERMGADVESPEFLAGSIGSPDLGDVARIAPILMAKGGSDLLQATRKAANKPQTKHKVGLGDLLARGDLSDFDASVYRLTDELEGLHGLDKQGIPLIHVSPWQGRFAGKQGDAIVFSSALPLDDPRVADALNRAKAIAKEKGAPIVFPQSAIGGLTENEQALRNYGLKAYVARQGDTWPGDASEVIAGPDEWFRKPNPIVAYWDGSDAGLGEVKLGPGLKTDPYGIQSGTSPLPLASEPVASKYDVPAGSRPEYLGAAPDRTEISHVRYTPAKGASARVKHSISAMQDPDNPVRQQMLADIAEGQRLGGDSWYNTEELRNWFIDELGEERGDAEWRGFMNLMGATSPGSNVMANLGNASAVRARMAQDPQYLEDLLNVESLKGGQELARGRPKGYGHKTAGLQEYVTARYVKGNWEGFPEPGVPPAQGSWTQNPKPKGFSASLMGSERNIAADLHFTRYFAMASGDPDWLENTADVSDAFRKRVLSEHPEAAKFFKQRDINGKKVWNFSPKKAAKAGAVEMDTIRHYPAAWASAPNDIEYGAMEAYMGELARELDMTPAQLQANLWMGAAERTGVHPESLGTFMQLIRRRAAKTAKREGKSTAQVLEDFIKNEGKLALPIGALGLSQAVQYDQQSTD